MKGKSCGSSLSCLTDGCTCVLVLSGVHGRQPIGLVCGVTLEVEVVVVSHTCLGVEFRRRELVCYSRTCLSFSHRKEYGSVDVIVENGRVSRVTDRGRKGVQGLRGREGSKVEND